MVDEKQEKIEDEVDINIRSQTIFFLMKTCYSPNETEILSFFKNNDLLNSPYKIQFIIKALLIAIFYNQNSNDLKNIIIQIIKTFENTYPDHAISYTRFLKEQISSFIIAYHINPNLYNIHNLNIFFIPQNEYRLPCLEVIQKDDIDILQQILLCNSQLSQKKFQMVSLNHKLGKFQELYLMDFAAYYGSIKIFKFLFLSKEAKYSDIINCFAVAGGNTEIIHICETISNNYEICLNVSVQFHKNDIYDWLIMNKNAEPDLECLLSSIRFHNMILFIDIIDFFFETNKQEEIINNIHEIIECMIHSFEPYMLQYILNNLNVPKCDDFQNEALLAIKILAFQCFEILINFFDYSSIENSATILFFTSIKYSVMPFVEIISNKYDDIIDYNYQDEKGQTALHLSVILNDLNKTQYLLNKCKKVNIDINIKDNSSLTPFLYAIKEGNEEIVKLFLNSKKVRGNDHDQISINYFLITELHFYLIFF